MRLGDKLILVSSAIVIAVLGCGGFLAMRAYEDFQVRLAKGQALQHADVIAKSVRYHMLKNRRDDVQWIIETVGRREGLFDIRVFNDKGAVAYASRRQDIGGREDIASERCAYCHAPGARLAPETTTLDAARLVTSGAGSRQIAVMAPIRNEPACHGCHPARRKVLGSLEVIQTVDELARQIAANRRRSLVLLVVLVVLIAAAQGLLTLHEVTLPVGRLHAGFDRVAAGDLASRVDAAGSGELAALSRAFNCLTGQLQEAKARLDHWTDELSAQVARATGELRESNRRLEAASRLKSDFVRDVSHELRAPLGSIASCLHAVLGGYAADERTRQELLERACRKTEALTQMVRDLLDLARLGESGQPCSRESVDLAALLGRAGELFQAKAAERGVRLELELAPGVPPVDADPRDLEMLVTNLLDNAIKYNRRGGRATAALGVRDGAVRLTVADTGIGIAREDMPRLFNEFFRSEAARKHEKEGTGLGLSIVKKLVDRQGGSLSVHSEAGVGTRFEISFAARVA